MSDQYLREIPFNYTSANDEQVVRYLFGSSVWEALEQLRATRVTGRSARLLMRLMGDMFVLRRNPFLFQQLVESPRRRHRLFRTIHRELEVIERSAAGDPRVLEVTRRCQEYTRSLAREISTAPWRRAKLRRALGAVVGESRVHFDPFALVSHATDATDWRLHCPVAVARPAEEGQVAPLLRAIAKAKLCAIPRGAGTGLTGGAVPLRADCVMVNLEALNRIRGIRSEKFETDDGEREGGVLEAEAGVVTEDAIAAAAARGLVFATDPTSAWACTIGGNLAENAGGKSAVLWGTALDNLLSYRIVMPSGVTCDVRRIRHPLRRIRSDDLVRFEVSCDDGTPARTIELAGSDIRKPGLGKDVTNKVLGGLPGVQKEGTDGIITSACFILHRAYRHQQTFCLEFFGEDLEEASRVIHLLSEGFADRGEEALVALEHFDEEYVRAIGYRTKAPRQERPKAVLLVDMVAHAPEQLERGTAQLEALLEPYRDTVLFRARDAAEGKRFWQDRKQMGAIAKRTNAFKLNEDIVLPLPALAAFARWVDEFNLQEERHVRLSFLAGLEKELECVQPGDDADWVGPKLVAARELLERVRGKLDGTPDEELRDRSFMAELRDRLLDLFRGYASVCSAVQRIFESSRARRIVVATHMHAGDGNVHVNIPVFSNDREMMKRAVRAADLAMEKAVELGGVVTGEHGIGITKLKHLQPERRAALDEYRQQVDPTGMMNPGKLSDLDVLDTVFTPSFNLLELEATILQHHSLRELADKISRCVRCGKCKPNCCVFYPDEQLFYHPRNKNLAVGALIEALLYQAQRLHSTRFEPLKQLEEVADHCTICHKCLAPCPVKIDTGEVSVLERRILAVRRHKHTSLATRASLRYLVSQGRVFNALFRVLVLRWGVGLQRIAAWLVRWLPGQWRRMRRWPLSLLSSPLPRPPRTSLRAEMPRCLPNQALVLEPAGDARHTVLYFPGCGSERLYSDIGKASVYILLEAGCRVVLPPPYLCCGFPMEANAKTAEQAGKRLSDTIIFSQIREMMRHLSFDATVVSCGTCREALDGMGLEEIFGCKIEDVSRFVLRAGLSVRGGGRCLYHRPCHDSLDDGAAALLRDHGVAEVVSVPHCCSEAGTLALSRPDISFKMLVRKGDAVRRAAAEVPRGAPILTNCPTCLQGLGRNAALGVTPRHLAVELAERAGGADWLRSLRERARHAEVVNF